MACDHPLESAKLENVTLSPDGSTTLAFTCVRCLAPITKQFAGPSPEPEGSHGHVTKVSEWHYLVT